MPARLRLLVSTLGVIAVATAVALARPGNPGTNAAGEPIFTWFEDPISTIRSDGGGDYADGNQNVQNQLIDNSEGNFVLDTNTSSKSQIRSVILEFGAQLATLTGTRPFCTEYANCVKSVDALLITRSAFFDGRDDLRQLAIGQMIPKRLELTWFDGNTEFALMFDGQLGAAFVDFECTAASDGRCLRLAARPGTWQLMEQAGSGACPASAYNCYDGPVISSAAGLYYRTKPGRDRIFLKTVNLPFTLHASRG